ncbi:MAG: hypothetical protein DRJ08_00245 [Acidobacteria bacterium]|nr:MAG: hypothetical protein DRJ08_00245 [Acidobacteriota bacterium]
MKNRILMFVLGFLLCGVTAFAQVSTKATVNGLVVDDQGTALPGVTVVLTNMEQGAKRTVVTDANGKFRAPFLPLGTYTVEASLAGFGTYSAKDLKLGLGDIVNYKITMKPEKLSESIVVTAEKPLIETQKVDVTASIGDDYIENLPVQGRDFKDFVLLTPGVSEAAGSRVTGMGTRGIMNNLQIDGAGYNSTFFGEQRGSTRIPFTFSQETIKEFNVVSNGYSAKYGNASGLIINAVTKSGSNEYHGSAHWFRQTDSMMNANAPSEYDPLPLSMRKNDFTKDQFGFTVSGPIIKDKLFFFVAYDAQRRDSTFTWKFRERSGYDAFAAAFPDIIAANEGPAPETEDNDVYFMKLDWQINENNRLSLRVNRQEFTAENGTNSHNYVTDGITSNGVEEDFSTSVVLELTSILSDTMFNEARVQWSQEHRPRYANTTDMMEVNIGSYDALFGQNNFLPNWLNETLNEFQDDFTWMINDTHTLRAGVRYAQYDYDDMFFRYGGGSMRFYGGYNDFLAWVGDDPSNDPGRYDMKYTQSFSPINGVVKYSADEADAYIQDSWQFNAKTLVEYGIRYSSQSFDDMINPNPELAILGLEELPDENNIAPRLGITYDVTGEGTDLIRLGAGLFYNRTPSLLAANAILTNGVNVIRNEFRPGDPLFPTDLTDRISPSELDPQNPYPPDVFVFSPDWQNPYTFKPSLSYEKALDDVWKVAVDLKYTRGYHFERKLDTNLGIKDADGDGVQDVDDYGRPLWDSRHRPNTNFRKIMTFMSDGSSKASSITFRVNKKFANRWSMFASYTLSSSFDVDTNERSVSSSGSGYPTNPANLMDDWGRSDYFNKSQFKFSWTVLLWYDIRFSGYHRFYSGRPYTVTSGYDDNGDGFYNDYAVIDGVLGSRNTYRQPNFNQTDIRLSRRFNFMRHHSIELIFEMFNVFDSSNDYTTMTNYRYDADHLGVLDRASLTPRQYQLGIKYRF